MARRFAKRMVSLYLCGRNVCCMPSKAVAQPRWVAIWNAAINVAMNATHTTRVPTAIAPSANL